MNKATALRIKELRSRKGFSQEKLADETGLNIRTIQRIENGETEPPFLQSMISDLISVDL